MKYERFEDVPVWKDALQFVIEANRFVKISPLKNDRDYTSQWRRAALSISNNIAEGFESGTTEQLITFIYIARGSAGECRSMTYVFERLPEYTNFKSEISNLRSQAETISRQLRGWAESLQNSPIQGQRRLTDNVRKQFQFKKEQKEFDGYLAKIVEEGRKNENAKLGHDLKSQI